LQSFQIVPVFWGDWSTSQIDTQNAYLKNLADYISSKNVPAGQQPVIAQYAVSSASVAPPVIANSPSSPSYVPPSKFKSTCEGPPVVAGTIYNCDGPAIIASIPAVHYSPTTLVILFLGSGFILDPSCKCSGYHHSITSSQFLAVIPQDPVTSAYSGHKLEGVTSHEVFEGATDPVQGNPAQWGWLTKVDSKGNANEAADQCSHLVTIIWPAAPGGILEFAQITDNFNGAVCSATGYIPLRLTYPIGLSLNQTLRLSLVAGPVTPLPGTPVEVGLGFVDLNGDPIGQSSIVPVVAGQVATLDLNANVLGIRQGQHVEVRPVVNRVGAILPPLKMTAEIFDSATGIGSVLESGPTVPGPAFGPQGLTGGQTIRITVIAYPPNPCAGTLSFADRSGAAIGPTLPVNLTPGQGASLDLNSNMLGLAALQRIELQPMVTLQTPATGSVACAASSEVFGTITGRTATYQISVAGQAAASSGTAAGTIDPLPQQQ
jgi:hypothetical protein